MLNPCPKCKVQNVAAKIPALVDIDRVRSALVWQLTKLLLQFLSGNSTQKRLKSSCKDSSSSWHQPYSLGFVKSSFQVLVSAKNCPITYNKSLQLTASQVCKATKVTTWARAKTSENFISKFCCCKTNCLATLPSTGLMFPEIVKFYHSWY